MRKMNSMKNALKNDDAQNDILNQQNFRRQASAELGRKRLDRQIAGNFPLPFFVSFPFDISGRSRKFKRGVNGVKLLGVALSRPLILRTLIFLINN